MRILVAIASHGTRNDQYLSRLIEEYQSMPYSVDIVVLSNIRKPVPAGVDLLVGLPTRDPWSLPFGHKKLFADHVEEYDLFIYSEDDMLITQTNLESFLRASAILDPDEIPGFLRVEKDPQGSINYPEVHGHFHWDPKSVRIRGQHTFAFFTCEHSACYVLTREQLKRAIESGNFVVEPHKGKYDLLCSAATDPYTQCGLEKVICISQIDDFLVHHLPNKYIGTRFGVDEAEFRRQIVALSRMGTNGHGSIPLFNTETRVENGKYSKDYYEPARQELDTLIPHNVRTVLSIGCGSGATELGLAKRGLQVTAIPLDPLIPGEELRQRVEVISTDFFTASKGLKDRKFDCLLLLNVLHLAPDPARLLSSLSAFLSAQSVAIALVPNMRQISAFWRRPKQGVLPRRAMDFEKFGVQFSSHRTARQWFREAGLTVYKTLDVLEPRTERITRLMFGMTAQVLGSEFFALAKLR
jgi:SAM-dependent methyltransferase